MKHLVNLLGLNRVKAMAVLIAVNAMVKPAMRIEGLRKFWVHSLVTAILTEESARIAKSSVDGVYTAGLLHDLGVLGLMSAYPEEYAGMIDVSTEFGLDLLRTERDLFEIDHCATGAWLATEWNFPEPIVLAIASHHKDPDKSASLFNLVQICWRLADVVALEHVRWKNPGTTKLSFLTFRIRPPRGWPPAPTPWRARSPHGSVISACRNDYGILNLI